MSLPRRRPRKNLEDDLLDGWSDDRHDNGKTASHVERPKPATPKRTRRAAAPKRGRRRDEDLPPKDEPFTYHGYDGDGYPKGMVDDDGFPIGPIVRRYDEIRRKYVKVTGIAYEDLPRSYQKILDRKPYDDAGMLRIFRKPVPDPRHPDRPMLTGGNIFPEYGSYEEAKKFFNSMKSMEDSIYNGENIGYSDREQLDDLHVYTTENSKNDGCRADQEDGSPGDDGKTVS